VSNLLSDLSAPLTLPFRTIEEGTNDHHKPVEQLQKTRCRASDGFTETRKAVNAGSRHLMDVSFLDEISLDAF
jgi:hypothetical protein